MDETNNSPTAIRSRGGQDLNLGAVFIAAGKVRYAWLRYAHRNHVPLPDFAILLLAKDRRLQTLVANNSTLRERYFALLADRMRHIRCPSPQKLMEFATGDLDEQIKEHLKTCKACSREVKTLKDELPDPDMSEGLIIRS